MEQKKNGSGNWVIREGKWNKKVGTARWDGGWKMELEERRVQRGGSWGISSIKTGEGVRT